jgi:hypothetical protein
VSWGRGPNPFVYNSFGLKRNCTIVAVLRQLERGFEPFSKTGGEGRTIYLFVGTLKRGHAKYIIVERITRRGITILLQVVPLKLFLGNPMGCIFTIARGCPEGVSLLTLLLLFTIIVVLKSCQDKYMSWALLVTISTVCGDKEGS